VDHAHSLLKLLIAKRHLFDPAAFMPVIDALGDRGKKQDVDMLSAKMMEMADCSDGLGTDSCKITPGSCKHEHDRNGESDWRTLLHRYLHDQLPFAMFLRFFFCLFDFMFLEHLVYNLPFQI
jgi:hypothetical protein